MIINYDVNNKGGGGASAEGCVRYDQQQELTDEQQQQAKDNLGIEDPEPQAAVLYDQQQSLTDAQKQQALTNIGAAPLIIKTLDFDFLTPSNFYQLVQAFRAGRTAIISTDGGSNDNLYQVFHCDSGTEGETLLYVADSYYIYRLETADGEVCCTATKILPEAPSDGKQYARKNREWVDVQGGGEAVQSDWNETDTDDPAFIKNKPTILEPFVVDVNDYIGRLTAAQIMQLYEAFAAGRPTFIKAKTKTAASAKPELMQIISVQNYPPSGGLTNIYMSAIGSQYVHDIMLFGETVQCSIRLFFSDVNNDNKTYARRNKSWVELPAIPEPENHQLLKSALSEPMGCSANTWATLCELNVPEDGAYQVSASARMLPADQSTAFKTATVSIELGTDAAGYTEVMEMTLPRSGEYGTLSVPVNATAGQKLRLRAISEANFYAQASPSAGKASATFIAAVRVGAIYQAQ